MSTTVKLKEKTLTELKKFGSMGQSWDDVVNVVLERAKKLTASTGDLVFTKSTHENEFKEATVDKWGKAPIGRPYKGKTIKYLVIK